MPRSAAQRKPSEARQRRAPSLDEQQQQQPQPQGLPHEGRVKNQIVLVPLELTEPAAIALANALRLAFRVLQTLAKQGFITPTDPHTLDSIAVTQLAAERLESAIERERKARRFAPIEPGL